MEMLKKLHAKVFLAGTAALILAVAVVLGVLNLIVYNDMLEQIYREAGYIAYYGGKLPEENEEEEASAHAQGIDYPPEYHERMRFFLAYTDASGRLTNMNLSRIASITPEAAAEMSERILASGETRGRGAYAKNRGYYAYRLSPLADGGQLLVVMDCTREWQIMREFMYFSLIVGAVAIALYILLFAFFSKRIMAPFQRNMKSQRQFITNAGHELRTPIAIISANSEVLEMMNGKNEWTTTILRQTKRLSDLVDGLLSIAKIEERSDEFRIVDVDGSKLVNDAAASFREIAKEGAKSLTAAVEEGLIVKADERLFYTLVNILVDNAIKYCDDGGMVHVVFERKAKSVQLLVSNDYKDGAGVDYTRFFDRFYREDASHSSEKKGFGIGLSMASEIVGYCGGSIDVRYEESRIAFAVRLKAGEASVSNRQM
ncbi:HAMP domain-containing sensor histidine kinase [Selenomonas sp. TAMA-11512]|uniref:sensor histidine kinase n=1 Tax=Selenomonas sp. TAMA-11512 TaxID=3095337 RepID=UPI0030873A3C|nr:HAMP domain-containing sensor histidine kinase [Selenomonas sp. TAMA-11512]